MTSLFRSTARRWEPVMTQETHCSTLRGCGLVLWAVVGLVCAGVIPAASSIANAAEPAAAASPAKAVVPVDVTELQVFPAALQLSSIRDSRRVLVTACSRAASPG